jgi:hypothetical protein
LLAGHHDIDAPTLSDAIAATAAFRQVELRPVGDVLRTLGQDRQSQWQRYLARAGLEGFLPSEFPEAIRQVTCFADPVITGVVTRGRWDHQHAQWIA